LPAREEASLKRRQGTQRRGGRRAGFPLQRLRQRNCRNVERKQRVYRREDKQRRNHGIEERRRDSDCDRHQRRRGQELNDQPKEGLLAPYEPRGLRARQLVEIDVNYGLQHERGSQEDHAYGVEGEAGLGEPPLGLEGLIRHVRRQRRDYYVKDKQYYSYLRASTMFILLPL
jgi:hypothetical protein